MEKVLTAVAQLVRYGIEKHLIEPSDAVYARNGLLTLLKIDRYEEVDCEAQPPLEEILAVLLDYAASAGLIDGESITERDLFDTALMGVLTPRPSEVQKTFFALHAEKGARAASDYFISLAKDSDYIRTYRVKKDRKWKTPSLYGEMDITINLSKPEKDPRAIAAAAKMKSGYPACLLCHDNEGFSGNMSKPARQTLRQIPLQMGGERWYLQYSPYVYYNEHCIALSSEHTPMKISEKTFARMLDFVSFLPHYFIGSNADLPIVGGSILSHDHMQGGCYEFAMERATIETPLYFDGFDTVTAGIVAWPMSVIRLRSSDRDAISRLAVQILSSWRGYTDEDAFVFAETEGVSHHTVTPIARRRGEDFELDLVLRDNITTSEHPLGVYHPHAELHHIKKENIGLIEVMGLAVLPARLSREIAKMTAYLKNPATAVSSVENDPETASHGDWLAEILPQYPRVQSGTADESEITAMLENEIGRVFVRVLEDAGVYKRTEEGKRAFLRFALFAGGKESR